MGTREGLNRFDGRKFVNYTIRIPGEHHSFTGNFIRCITEDKRGILWVGTQDGLVCLDPLSNRFSRVQFQTGLSQKLQLPVITSLACDQQRQLRWAGGNGLFLCPGNKGELQPVPGSINEELFFKQGILVHSILPDGGRLWIASTRGLYLYDTLSYHWQEIPVAPRNPVQPGYPVPATDLQLASGRLWMTTWGFGLAEIDTAQKRILLFHLPMPEKIHNASFNIFGGMSQTSYPGEENILWVAGTTGSLQAFDIASGSFKKYAAKNWTDPYGVYMTGICTFFAAESGLWIGSDMGLYQYDAGQQRIREMGFAGDRREPDEHSILFDKLYADPADPTGNTIWIGTNNKGFYKYNLQTGSYLQVNDQFGGLLPAAYYVSSVYRDKNGILWVATLLNGILRYDEKIRKVSRFVITHEGQPVNWVVKIIPDRKDDHILWAATAAGLFRLQTVTGQVQLLGLNKNNKDFSNSSISDICTDKDAGIWFTGFHEASGTDIIGKFLTGDSTARLLLANVHTKGELPLQPDEIVAGPGGRVWVNTGQGLYYFNAAEANPVLQLFRSPALANGIRASHIIMDKFENTWILAGSRLYLLDAAGEKMQELLFPALQSATNITLHANGVTGQGLAGTWFRFFVIEPAGKQMTVHPVKFYITGLRTGAGYYRDQQADFSNRSISLPFRNNSVTLEFAAVSFTYGHTPMFYYRMEGYDDDWSSTFNTSISYKLPPGRYRFLLKVAGPDGNPGEVVIYTAIRIRPPFYKTAGFIICFLLLLASGLYVLYRYRVNQLLRMQQMRNTISHNLHDEIGSTLTSISILSSVSQQALEKDPEQAKEMLEKIALQSKTIQQNMSDIVWAIRSDNDKLESLLARMREYAAQTLEPLQVLTLFRVDDSLLNKALALERRKEVLLIFKEAVNNIAKHAGASEVHISLEKEDHQLKLRIRDNGKWKGNGHSSGTGTGSMRQRAASAGGSLEIIPGEGGTTVTLFLPLT